MGGDANTGDSDGFMNKSVMMLGRITLVVSLACAVVAPQQIATGGPIPDKRGFNNSVDNPKLTDPVEEVVRRVARNV